MASCLYRGFPTLAIGALAVLAAPAAFAWDTRTTLPDMPPGVLHPHGVASNALGLWASGDGLVRYDRAGRNVLAAGYLEERGLLVATADGGVVTTTENLGPFEYGPYFLPCRLDAYDAQGRTLWHNTLNPKSCGQIGVDAGGRIWVMPAEDVPADDLTKAGARDLYLLSPRGETINHLSFNRPVADLLADTREESAFVYDGASLRAYDRVGNERWNHSVNTTAGKGGRLALYDDHTLLLADVSATTGALQVLKFDTDGTLLRQHKTSVAPPPLAVLALAAAPDGGAFVLERTVPGAADFILRRLDAAGNSLWNKALVGDTDCARLRNRCVLRVTHSGVVLLARQAPARNLDPTLPADASAVYLESFDADGQRIESHALAGDRLGGFATLADDATLVTAHFWTLDTPYASSRLADAWVSLGADGHALPTPPTEGARSDAGRTIAGLVASDGDSYVLRGAGRDPVMEIADSPSRFALNRIGADGRVKWQELGDGAWDANTALVADADRVCASGLLHSLPAPGLHWRESCFERTSGSPLWSHDYAAPSHMYLSGAALALMPDHSLVSVTTSAGTALTGSGTHRRYAANGTLQRSAAIIGGYPDASKASCNASGDCVVPGDGSLRYLRADATQRYLVNTPVLASGHRMDLHQLLLAEDGSLMALGYEYGATQHLMLWSLAPDGSQRALRILADAPLTINAALASVDSDFGLVVGGSQGYVARIGLTGEAIWQQAMALPDRVSIVPTSTSGPCLLMDHQHHLSLFVLDETDGHELARRQEGCADDLCDMGPARVDATGTLHAIFFRGHDGAGRSSVYGLDHITTTPPSPVRIDQHALTGAWWAPYTGGQGFMLDYLPATRTFFMPWFTFTTAEKNSASEQRWYTIQGTVGENAKFLTLPIYDSRGGAFDANTPAAPTHVGDASLRFEDCDHASLHYAFLPGYNEARSGDISLSRLLPREEDCVLADGSSQPAPPAAPGTRAFTAKLNGSWYEPATGGQGLQLEVWPGELLFSAWFTYDPADRADDETRQHWLTLQGSFSGAGNTATVRIAQAVGGGFDAAPAYNQYALGTATLTVQGCDRIRLDYRFDDADLAAAYRGRSGSIDLVKIGGCTP